MTRVETHRDVLIDAGSAEVFAAMVDWESQQDWMIGTKVEVTSGDGAAVGSMLAARTGAGPIGFVDTMTITEWDAPRRVVVLHTGRVVRGEGVFEVFDLPGGRSRLRWTELLDLPLGALGRVGFAVLEPVVGLGLSASLRALRASIERG